MNLLFTGKGSSGSWIVRGEQLGTAVGAKVKANAMRQDLNGIDLAVVVKRTTEPVMRAIREAGIPWVYDIVDCYPQPKSAEWPKEQAIAWIHTRLQELKPHAVIWPNHCMRNDCDPGLPGMVLKHHFRPGIARNPIREKVTCIGYEGSAAYLESWRGLIDSECAKRGWRFEVNPKELADLDIVLAIRGGKWDGYVSRNWKSAIKMANAHASGTPFIGSRECGYLENASGVEYWADDINEMRVTFDWLSDQGTREIISERFLQKAYSVDMAAADLYEFLRGLK